MEVGSDGREHPCLLTFDKDSENEFFYRYYKHVDEFNNESFPHSLRGRGQNSRFMPVGSRPFFMLFTTLIGRLTSSRS